MREGNEERAEQDVQPGIPGAWHEECEVCGSEMFGLHCKLICSNCGYRRDCSDP